MNRLFWDIETSPNIMYSWRSGPKLFVPVENVLEGHERRIICISYKWEGQKRVHNLCWNDGDDTEMIKAFMPVMAQADEMVAHNGDNFDMKWYNARHLIHGLPPVPMAITVDTLKWARRYFYLDSNRLDFLANTLLGERKIHTSFDLWRKCMKIETPDKDVRDRNLRKMVRYCNRDVHLLERVWDKLRGYAPATTHEAVTQSGNTKDRWKCPHCASDDVVTNKRRATATGMVRWSMQCKSCGKYYSIANSVHDWYLEEKE
jgi:hypothetical protein